MGLRGNWIFGFFLGVLSQTGSALGLADAIQLAQQNDPQWSAIANRYAADSQIVAQGRSELLPSVVITGNSYRNEYEDDVTPEREYDSQNVSVVATQPLVRPGNWFAWEGASATGDAVEHNFRAARFQYQLQAAELFFDVLRAIEQLRSREAEEQATLRQLDQARQRLDVGLGTRTEVYEAQAAYDATGVNLLLARNNLQVTSERLATSIGRPVRSDDIDELPAALPTGMPEPADMEAWVKIATSNSPALLAQESNLRAARARHHQAGSQHLPTVDLVARRTDSSSDITGSDIESETVSTGVEFNWVLFGGGAVNSARKQAKHDALAAQDDYVYAQLSVAQEVRNRYRTLETQSLRVQAQLRALESSESALEAVQAGYDVGTRNIVDLLNAQRAVFAAREAWANARFDYVLAWIALKQAAGVLDERDFSRWQIASSTPATATDSAEAAP